MLSSPAAERVEVDSGDESIVWAIPEGAKAGDKQEEPKQSRKRPYEGFSAHTPHKKRKMDEAVAAQREFEEKLTPLLRKSLYFYHGAIFDEVLTKEILPALFLNTRPDLDLEKKHYTGVSFNFLRLQALFATWINSNLDAATSKMYHAAFIELSKQGKIDWDEVGVIGDQTGTLLVFCLQNIVNRVARLNPDPFLEHLSDLVKHKKLDWNYVPKQHPAVKRATPLWLLGALSRTDHDALNCLNNLIRYQINHLDFSLSPDPAAEQDGRMFDGVVEQERALMSCRISLAWVKWMIAEQESPTEIEFYLENTVYPAAKNAIQMGYPSAGISLAKFFEKLGRQADAEIWVGKAVEAKPPIKAEDYHEFEKDICKIVKSILDRIDRHIKKNACHTPEEHQRRKDSNEKRAKALLGVYELMLKAPGKLGDSIRADIAYQYVRNGQGTAIADPLAAVASKDNPTLCIAFLQKCKEEEKLRRKIAKLQLGQGGSIRSSL